MRCNLLRSFFLIALIWFLSFAQNTFSQNQEMGPGEGELRISGALLGEASLCPLKSTSTEAVLMGHSAYTKVKQTFTNDSTSKIEAVYVFPLPNDAAVESMSMTIGDRIIKGEIKPRQEAAKIYEAAKKEGHVASLMEQQKPNIFTQSVANIEPGAEVVIEIGYVATLKMEDGVYEYSLPMTIGPRYNTGNDSVNPDSPEMEGPVYVKPEVRTGNNVSINVLIDAGVEIYEIESIQHEIDIIRPGKTAAEINLKNKDEIPNRDFILKFRVADDEIKNTFFVTPDDRGDFFTFVMNPPVKIQPNEIMPKEMLFVIDSSGSMIGEPFAKAVEAMKLCISNMNPRDSFNLICFSSTIEKTFPSPVENNPANVSKAIDFLNNFQCGGGTEMLSPINEALNYPEDPERLRIVCFMTDGYVGNDYEIIAAVKKNAAKAHIFSFGVGTSVNRFLLDGIAEAGRGDVEYITLGSDNYDAANRFYNRINIPLLINIKIDWGGLEVYDVYPKELPDLFSRKPLVVYGRLKNRANSVIKISADRGNGDIFTDEINVEFPASLHEFDASPALWAKAKINELTSRYVLGCNYIKTGEIKSSLEYEKEIVALSMEYNVLTEFTSFVAVEYERKTADGELVKAEVPINLPQGNNMAGFGMGATNDPLYLIIGLLFIAASALVYISRRNYALSNVIK